MPDRNTVPVCAANRAGAGSEIVRGETGEFLPRAQRRAVGSRSRGNAEEEYSVR
jgi:hypothetical protein